jgi:hypothetical protein
MSKQKSLSATGTTLSQVHPVNREDISKRMRKGKTLKEKISPNILHLAPKIHCQNWNTNLSRLYARQWEAPQQNICKYAEVVRFRLTYLQISLGLL